jgi:hypothetical protein
VRFRAQLRLCAPRAIASRRAAELADVRYREGAADYLVLLDAQRTQLDAEDAVAQAEADVNGSLSQSTRRLEDWDCHFEPLSWRDSKRVLENDHRGRSVGDP